MEVKREFAYSNIKFIIYIYLNFSILKLYIVELYYFIVTRVILFYCHPKYFYISTIIYYI